MSKVKLIVFEGYGTTYRPYIDSNSEVIDLKLNIPDTHSIAGVIRTDFDADPDGSRRASDALTPVIECDRINNLVGRLLTQIDATFSDPEQRKAMKDLFTQIAWGWYEGQTDQLREPWQENKFPKFKNRFDEHRTKESEQMARDLADSHI
jgi:hypothetical protein